MAFGHHRWYDGTKGYPKEYIRTNSDYRQMVDVAASSVYKIENYNGNIDDLSEKMLSLAHKQFSPMVVSCLMDKDIKEEINRILSEDDRIYYKELYEELKV